MRAKTRFSGIKRIIALILAVLMVVGFFKLGDWLPNVRAAAGDVPAHEKKLTNNKDGTYTISLTVTGDSEKKAQKVNVIVIVDRSGSMGDDSGNATVTYTPTNTSANNLYGTFESNPDTNNDEDFFALTRQGYTNNYVYTYPSQGSVAYTPTNSNNGTQYGLVNGEYVQLTRHSSSSWGGGYYWTYGNNTRYDGTRYQRQNNQAEYTGQRYSRQEANQSRLEATQEAVNSLAESLLANNGGDNPDDTVEMALVSFATNAQTNLSPTTSYSTFSSAVNNLNDDGGTNWEAALQEADDIDFGDDDQTFVIFFSDGAPTFHSTNGGYNNWNSTYRVYGSGREEEPNMQRSYTQATDDAASLASKVGASNFFTIFAYGESYGATYMTNLTSAAGAPAGNNYSASNTAALQEAFNEILNKIEMAGIGDVDVVDGTTNQVRTSSGEMAELLEVDTSSFKYYRSGGDYGDMTEWSDAPEATFTNGKVDWDLSDEGVLENGVTYTVTFDCYPSQTTYDIIAQLKNGDITYASLDSEIKKYIKDNGDGSYTLLTNTNATLDYDDTRTDEDESPVGYVNPDPVATDAETLTVNKTWEGGNPDVSSLKMTVLMDGDPFHEAELTNTNNWSSSSFISIGIIKDGRVLSGAEGHDFTFAELDDTQYHWELVSPTVRPMLINGTKTMLVKEDNDHPVPSGATTYEIDGATYYVDSSAAGLTATNHRRSDLNIKKVVTGDDAPEGAEFPFTLTVDNSKAPDNEPEDDPEHNSDYWLWFSIYDTKAGATVMDATVSATGLVGPASDGYYYVPNNTAITVNMQDGWNLRFLNLPTDTTYTFAEGNMPEGFTFVKSELVQGEDESFEDGKTTTGTIENTKTSYAVEFTNDYALTNLEITKVWDDEDNQDGKRLTADELKAKLTLSPAVQGKEATVTDNGDGTYTITYTGLPRYNNGEEVTYTVTESPIDGYDTTGSPAEDHGTITNTHTPATVDVTAIKEWEGTDDNTKLPDSITVQLLANKEEYEEAVELTEEGNWSYTWEELPKYEDGKEIEYTVDEVEVPSYFDQEVGEPEVGEDGNITITITNTYKASGKAKIEATKAISGAAWPNGKKATFTLTGTGDAPMPEEDAEVTLTATGKATFGEIEFTEADAGKTYTYTITESTDFGDAWSGSPESITATVEVTDKGDGTLDVEVTYNPKDATITNTYKAEGEGQIEVTKALEGAAWPNGKKATFTLAGTGNAPMPEDGEDEVELTAAGKATFGEIKFTEADAGKTYTYTITESTDFGSAWSGSPESITATVEVTDNGDGTLDVEVTYNPKDATITNTYKAEGEGQIEVTKALEGAAWPNGKKATFTLAGTGNAPMPEDGEDEVELTAAGKATFGEIKFTEADAGKTYTYTITESTDFGSAWSGSPESITATVEVTDKGDGTLDVQVTYDPEDATITNSYTASGTAQIQVKKELEGASWPTGKLLHFTLTADEGTPMPENDEKTLANEGTLTFDEITYTQDDIGKSYTYTITEDGFGEGWSGSPSSVTATVTVTDNGNGTLTTEVKYTPEDQTFTNKYSASGEVDLEVTKALSGAEWPEDKSVTFTLSANNNGPLPENKTVTLNAAGTGTFDTIEFSEADSGKTYTYTITETTGFGTGWTISDPITVTIEVVDDGEGNLTPEVTYDPTNKTITNTYKATGSATLEVTKALEGASWPTNKTLTLTLEGSDDDTPMPETATATLSAAGNASFGPIAYDESDIGETYTYTISEDGFGAGWTGSGDITATVKVEDNGDGTLKITVTYDPEDQTITNTYKATGEAELQVTKALEGTTWPSGKTLTFTLKGEDNAPMPENTTVTMSAAGTETFDKIAYTQADIGKTYTYTISEDGFGTGWIASGDITAKVTISDNGNGTLKVDVEYTPENKTITNTYKAKGEAEIEVTKAISGAEWPEGKTITFTLEGSEGAPMPETATTQLSAAGTAAFDKISYTQADIGKSYTYTITEDGFGAGWNGSPASVTATVAITDNGDGTLAAEVTYNPTNKTITNTYSASGKVDLEVTKALSGAEWPEDKSVTFTLSANNNGPLPENKTVTLNAAGTGTFDTIEFSEADSGKTYTYTITETTGFGTGWTISDPITVTVEVVDDGEGHLTPEVTYTSDDKITNTYSASGATQLEVIKAVSGAAWPEGKSVTFTLSAEDGGPMPTTTTTTLNAAGMARFNEINFTEADSGKTYTYTITETTGFGDGWSVSGTVTATVKVNDDGEGNLTAEVTYTASDTITNTYTATGSTQLEVNKTLSGANWPSGKSVTFTLSADDGGPLPSPATATRSSVGTAQFAAINFTQDDIGKTYHYTITESAGLGDGWTASGTVTATVEVVDNGNGTLSANVTYTANDTITNTYAAEGSIQLTATKELVGRDWQSGESVTFTLLDSNGNVIDTQTISQNGTVTFATINYTLDDVGSKTYTISETSTLPSGVTKSTDITATVTISDNQDGTLATSVRYTNNDTITNTYTAAPVDAKIVVQKIIDGYISGQDKNGNVVDRTFNFTMTPVDGAPMPNNATSLSGSITTNGGKGTYTFPEIEFTFDDMKDANGNQVTSKEFQYQVVETAGSENGFTYDDTTYTVTVTVEDDGEGHLSVTDITKASDDTNVDVHNEFREASIEVTLHLTKEIEDLSNSAEDATFTFELLDNDGNVIETVEVTTEELKGQVDFSPLTFTASGEYKYRLRETVPTASSSSSPTTAAEEPADDAVTADEAPEDEITEASDEEATAEEAAEAEDAEEIVTTEEAEDDEIELAATQTVGAWTYDTTEYPVVITVTDNFETAELEASVTIDGKTTTSLTVTNVYKAAETEATLEVTKTIEDKSGSAYDTTFTFTLTGEDDDTPMPDSNTASVTGAGKATFDAITYEKAGTYNYTIKETKGDAAGYIYDETEYPVTVTVEDVDGELVATVAYGSNGETELSVENIYDPEDAEAAPRARKVVDDQSNSAPDETFTFQLIDSEGTVVETVTRENGGYVDFSTLTFDKVGEYTYTIKEVAGETNAYTYDDSELTVTIKVTDSKKGTLDAEVVYDGDEAVFTNVYKAEPTELSFGLTKETDGVTEDMAQQEFSFELKDEDGEVLQTVTTTGAGSVEFDPIEYEKAGTYRYTVVEVEGNAPGYTYDDTVYEVTVTVEDEDGKLTASAVFANDGDDAEEIVFHNPYEPDEVEVTIKATKKMEGRSLKDGEFTFKLEIDGKVVETVTNDANGNIKFTYTFTEVGEYAFKIYEVKGSEANVTYDETVYEGTVTVTDKGEGCLEAKVEGDGVTFTNKYKEPPKPTPTPTPTPPTGDSTNMWIWLYLLMAAGLMLTSLIYVRFRKNR